MDKVLDKKIEGNENNVHTSIDIHFNFHQNEANPQESQHFKFSHGLE